MSVKVGAVGGNNGGPFDDGVFDGVRKIIVGKDIYSVSYIKIEYEKDGKFETREHGTIKGELKEFSVDYPSEYITSVGGSYEHVSAYGSVLIRSLLFKTSYGRTSPILGHTTLFGNPSGTEFMLESKNGGKLLGFHGRSGQALDAIGPQFFAVSSTLKHFEPQGGNGGSAWDDGAFDGVRKVLVGRNGKFVSYVRFEYAKGERMVPHVHGKKQEAPQEFVVNYPNEHITSVEGTMDGYLSSLKFTTSEGRTSPTFGNVVGSKFVLGEKGFKLVGFCGRSGDAIDALGAHFSVIDVKPDGSQSSGTTVVKPTKKLEAIGGDEGVLWDDGAFEGVRKIYVGQGNDGVSFVKFEYNKGSETIIGDGHGKETVLGSETFELEYPSEYITAIGIYYDKIQMDTHGETLVTSFIFTTNKRKSQPYGLTGGEYFEFKEEGHKIVGFHGKAGNVVNQIGVYVAPITN